MNRKIDECKNTGMEVEATNKFTNDFIRKNANNIGKTCFTFIISNFT